MGLSFLGVGGVWGGCVGGPVGFWEEGAGNGKIVEWNG